MYVHASLYKYVGVNRLRYFVSVYTTSSTPITNEVPRCSTKSQLWPVVELQCADRVHGILVGGPTVDELIQRVEHLCQPRVATDECWECTTCLVLARTPTGRTLYGRQCFDLRFCSLATL